MKKLFFAVVTIVVMFFCGCGTNSFDPPSGVTIAAKAASIQLNWKATGSVIGYNVYRGTSSGPLATKTRIASGLTQLSYMDSTATPGVPYYYQVTTFNSTGDSTASLEVSATVKAKPVSVTVVGGASNGVPLAMSYTVSTMAGTGATGSADGTGTAASFKYPIGITSDGTNLFVADTFNNTIRKIVITAGTVTTLAGASASGAVNDTGSAARFNEPYGITTTDGTTLYVSDFGNNMIRSINVATGTVTTLAGVSTAGSKDDIGTKASFSGPRGITTDGANLYVADSGNHTIRKIVIATGTVTTLAGSSTTGKTDNNGTSATFYTPDGLTCDGTNLYVTDSTNHNIRKITISTTAVTTIAGSTISGAAPGSTDGIGTAATFNSPGGITTDGTSLYVADSKNNIIRKVDIITGAVTTVAGSGSPGLASGDGSAASFSQPMGITTDGANLFVTDYSYSLIREIL